MNGGIYLIRDDDQLVEMTEQKGNWRSWKLGVRHDICDRPTMKQKARFILRSRGKSKTAVATPEAAVQRVEEGTASLARSVYERGSVSTHVAGTRREVQQLKLYVEGILAELLEIQV